MEAKDFLTAIRATGMTQAEVAAETGIPQPTISKIERGDVKDVMARSYVALQRLLDQLESKPKKSAKRKQAA